MDAVEDVDGNLFLDCAAGIAVNSTGHSHPDVVAAIVDQAQKFLHMSGTDFYYEPQVRLAEEFNAIAPFILNARLKPLMLRTPERDKHIVNVSAMEGQFYRRWKTTRHPHTNMAKAALNMMTRTSATDYQLDGIHMNSVDTGWVTDEDPFAIARRKTREQRFHPPLDIVDGAARVVDPVISGFNTDTGALTYTPNTNFNGGDSFTFRVNDGTTNEEVLKVLIDRMGFLHGKFPWFNSQNAIAMTHLETALFWLEKRTADQRTADRKARGVEGKPQVT